MSDQHTGNDTTRTVARLPGLEIEVTHRRTAQAEQIAIALQATPSFEAFGRYLENANPFAVWAEAAQLMWWPWLSWLGARQMLTRPRHVSDAPPTLPEG